MSTDRTLSDSRHRFLSDGFIELVAVHFQRFCIINHSIFGLAHSIVLAALEIWAPKFSSIQLTRLPGDEREASTLCEVCATFLASSQIKKV